MSVKDDRVSGYISARKRCLHLPKADLCAALSILLAGSEVRQAKKKWIHGVPLSRWWGCFGVLGVGGM